MKRGVLALVLSGTAVVVVACVAVMLGVLSTCVGTAPEPPNAWRPPDPTDRDGPRRATPPREGTASPAPAPEAPAPAAQTGAVSVRVTAEGDVPIADAEVVLAEDEDEEDAARARTDGLGVATFDDVAAGPHVVRASAPGRVRSGWRAVTVDAGETADVAFTLDRGVVLVGVVLDAESGRPVGGATVVVEPGGGLDGAASASSDPAYGTATTGADGRFRVEVDPDTLVTPRITAPGHVPGGHTVTVPAGDTPRPPVEFRIDRAGRLVGTVRDPDGKAVAGARVYAVPADQPSLLANPEGGVSSSNGRTWTATKTTADAEGRYELDGLALGGDYLVFAKAQGWARSATRAGVVATAEAPSTSADLVLGRLGTLVVRVVGPDGKGVPATVTAWSDLAWPRPARTDAAGVLRLEGREPAKHTVEVAAPGWPKETVEVDVGDGQVAEVTVRLAKGVAIAGVAVDDLGEPVPGAHVRTHRPFDRESRDLPPSEAETTAGQDGAFCLDGLRSGAHVVGGWAQGHAAVDDVRAEAPASGVRVIFPRSASVTFRLRPPEGGAAPSEVYVSVGHRVPFSPPGHDLWGGSGSHPGWKAEGYSFDFDPGTSRLRVLTDAYAPIERRFELTPGQTLALGDLLLDRGIDLAGRVEDVSGAAVVGATVTTRDAFTPGWQSAASDANGIFRLARLAAGKVDVAVSAPGFLRQETALDVAPGGASATVRLARGALLRILVVDADGAPVANADVTVRDAAAAADADPVESDATDHRGEWSVRVPAGRWRVSVEDRDASAECEAVEGGARTVKLVAR